MYRSKDKKLMNHIKTEVLHATKGLEKEDRKYAIDYLKTHIRVDDVYQMAIKKFPGKELDLGKGSYQPKVVILTLDPITQDEQAKLGMAWRRLGLTENDLFYAHLRFIKTKKKQAERKHVIEKLIQILKPGLLLVFDNVEIEYDGTVHELHENISILTDPAQKEKRKELTTQLRQLKKESLF